MIYLKEGQTPLNLAYNDEIVHEANSKYQLSFKYPTNNPLWEDLVEETLLLADDLHGEQEFIIFEVEKHHGYITVYANQVATLLNNYSITELSVDNVSGNSVMRSLVSSIIREHNFTFYSDIANTHSLNLKNVTVATALFKDKHSILGQWGGDLIRDKYDIRLLSNGGSSKEALFMYKKNLKSYQQKKSIKDLRTRIHFTKTVKSQNEGEKDKVIAVTVDSPLINKYKNIYEGNLDVSDQDVTDEATLRKYGENYFKTTLCDVIEESIEIDVVGVQDEPVGIFDTVTVFHEKFNLDVKKKITKYTYKPMGRKLKTIGFGKIQLGLGTALSNMIDEAVSVQVESKVDAFKIQKNLSNLLKQDRTSIENQMKNLEEQAKAGVEVKKALFEADSTVPEVVRTKLLDAVEADIGRLKTIITEAELIKAIQAKLNYAEIKNALIDKAFINQIISDEKFTQQFEDGQVTTQNIFTKLKDNIKSNIAKEFITKDGVKKLVNDLTIDADGIRQITQQESSKVFENKKSQLQGINSYIHKKYSDYSDGRNMSDNSTLKYIGIYTGDKQQAPTNASEYSWTKIKLDGKLYKAYANSLTGLDFTLVEPDENSKLLAKNRPRVNIVNDNDISDIWQANMFISLQPNTKYTLTARAKGNSNKLWAYFRNNKTGEEYSWGQLEFRELETKSITFTTTEDVDDVLFKFVLVPEDADWTGIQIDWFTIHERFKRYSDFPANEPAQYHKYRYFGYVFKEGNPIASEVEWFDIQQTSITNDKYTHIVYSDYSDGSNFDREPKKYMGVARTTSPTQPTDKTAYKWFKVKGDDGVSSYIHRKYSDYSNGANMSDNSNLKYIGIYTGTSSTAPTTASSYSWSKIKGEDGANGVPGARGSDGRTSYLHTAYSNSATGDRDFSTTNSTNKEYIGTYSDFEINDSNDYRRYKWVKIKGENGRDGKSINENLVIGSGEPLTKAGHSWGGDWEVRTHPYYYNGNKKLMCLPNSTTRENFIKSSRFKLKRNTDYVISFKGFASANVSSMDVHVLGRRNNETSDFTLFTRPAPVINSKRLSSSELESVKNIRFNSGEMDEAFLRFDNNGSNNGQQAILFITEVKLEEGTTSTEWSPAYEDLQAHTLTANLRLDGTYINGVTNDVKAYLDVFYDGQKITDGFNAQVKFKGGILNTWSNFWAAKVDNAGFLTNVSWGNKEQPYPISLELIALVTYKDLNTVTNARMDNIPDVVAIKEVVKQYKTFDSRIDRFNSTIGEVKQQVLANEEKRNLILGSRMLSENDYKVFGNKDIVIRLQSYEGLPYVTLFLYGKTSNVWQGIGFNTSVNQFKQGEKYSVRIPMLISSTTVLDNGGYVEIKNHRTGEVLWKSRLDTNDVERDKWVVREFTFTASKTMNTSEYSFWIYVVRNGLLTFGKPYMCAGDSLPKNYSPAPEDAYLQNSRLESSISQTKDEIGLKVSKNEVISAINLSVEKNSQGRDEGIVKIKGEVLADNIHGKTFTGSKFKIGQYGFLQPIEKGLQINAPENFGSKRGIGLQIAGEGVGPKERGVPPGLFIYEDPDFTSGASIPSSVNRVLLTVAGMACFSTRVLGSVIKGQPILTNIDYSYPFSNVAPVKFIGYREGGFMHFYGTDNTNSDKWLIKVDQWGSDRKLKTDIKESEFNAIEFVDKLKFKEHGWNKDEVGYDRPHTKCGLIAQELQELDASLVVDYGKYLGLDGLRLINISLKAIQELSTENTNLKSQLNEMNERLNKLEDKINGSI